MGLTLFVTDENEHDVSNKIKFDTNKYSQDYDFLRHVFSNYITLNVKRLYGDTDPIPMRIKDNHLAKQWVTKNIKSDMNKKRLLELIETLENNNKLYLTFSN
jgi:hypothetical protein